MREWSSPPKAKNRRHTAKRQQSTQHPTSQHYTRQTFHHRHSSPTFTAAMRHACAAKALRLRHSHLATTPQRLLPCAIKATALRRQGKRTCRNVPPTTAQKPPHATPSMPAKPPTAPATATAHCPDFLLSVNSFQ